MTYRLLASSDCIDGNCPTFFVDDSTGTVKVRGYDPTDPTGKREIDVVIPAAKWATLLANLPSGGQ